jgi:hypothetical protein
LVIRYSDITNAKMQSRFALIGEGAFFFGRKNPEYFQGEVFGILILP